MKRMKIALIGLLVGLTLFFNIERLDFNQASSINIQAFVYPLGVAAVIAIIVFPVFSRISFFYTLTIWIGLYSSLKLLTFNDRPLFGGINTYLTITEACLIAVLVVLAHQVGRVLYDYLSAVEFVALASGGSKIPPLEEGIDRVYAEINRSRHYNRAMSVIVASMETKEMQFELPRLLVESQEKILQTYLTARLAKTLKAELRRMDIILEDKKNHRVIVISPEIDDRGSSALLERLNAIVDRQMGIQIHFGAATFPNKALTFEGLVQEAELDMKHNGYYPYREHSGVAD